MTATEQLKQSDAWDSTYQLPLTRKVNNPWIYMAYMDLLLRLKDEPGLDRQRVLDQFVRCEVIGEQGLFDRRETGSGGRTSHDEIMGAAHFHPWIARRILGYMDRNNDVFNNKREKIETFKDHFDLWQGRFLFLRPYLYACANERVDIFSQLLWSACLLIGGTFGRGPGDAGGRLKNWLMTERMQQFAVCRVAIAIWRTFVGKDAKYCLTIEPREHAIFGELAEPSWKVPPCIS